MTTNEDYVIEILIDTGLVTKSQVERAKAEAAKSGHTVVQALIDQGALTQEDVTRALAAHSSMDFVDLSQMTVSPEVIATISGEMARRFRVIPIAQVDTGLMVAIGGPASRACMAPVSLRPVRGRPSRPPAPPGR